MAGTNYPTALDDDTSLIVVVDTVTDVLAVHHNYLKDAVKAIETKVGISASTPTLGTVLKGTGTGESAWGTLALDDLSDVVISSPTLDQRLRYNGTAWVNADPVSASAGNGVEFFPDTTDIIAKTTENDFVLETLNKSPVTTAESVEGISCANNTVAGSGYLYNAALGRTVLDAGVWNFEFYASVSSVAGGRVSSLTENIYKVSPYTDPTVSITGSGTSRTCTASSGTPFATTKIDASATNTTASYVQTPKGLYQITARTSDTEVTIATPTGYSNESTVAFSVWKRVITSTTGTITSTGTNYSLYTTNVISDAITVAATDKLGMIIFGTSNNTTTVNYVYNGTTHYSHINTPLAIMHNNLPGLQGGTSNEYYHITAAQATVVGNTSGTNTGDQDLSVLVAKSTYDAHTILYAITDNTPVALTVGEQTVVGRVTGGNIAAISIDSDLSSVSANDDTIPSAKATKAYADQMILKSVLDANTVLYATTDNTPAALAVAASTIVGRKATGDIVALTATETRAILNVADGSTANPLDGWIPDSGWTYYNANSINVSSGAASRYSVGDRIKFTQHSVVKYGVIIAIASDTRITIAINTDYVVEDTATYPITLAYYSHQETPLGFPHWFNWTPVISVVGGTAPTYVTKFVNRYCIIGRKLFGRSYWYNATGGTAGAGTNYIGIAPPVQTASGDSGFIGYGWSSGTAGTKGIVSVLFATSAAAKMVLFLNTGAIIVGNDMSSDEREVALTFEYEI